MINQDNKLLYRARMYKYQVLEEHGAYIGLMGYDIDTKFFRFTPDGHLITKILYAWDGPSGPTEDDDTNLVPSLHHDEGYQAIRLGLLPLTLKPFFDDLLMAEMIERGKIKFKGKPILLWLYKRRAKAYHAAVTLFGASSCVPGSDNDDVKEVL